MTAARTTTLALGFVIAAFVGTAHAGDPRFGRSYRAPPSALDHPSLGWKYFKRAVPPTLLVPGVPHGAPRYYDAPRYAPRYQRQSQIESYSITGDIKPLAGAPSASVGIPFGFYFRETPPAVHAPSTDPNDLPNELGITKPEVEAAIVRLCEIDPRYALCEKLRQMQR